MIKHDLLSEIEVIPMLYSDSWAAETDQQECQTKVHILKMEL